MFTFYVQGPGTGGIGSGGASTWDIDDDMEEELREEASVVANNKKIHDDRNKHNVSSTHSGNDERNA